MKTIAITLFATLAGLLVAISGCGLVSGTVFISQPVDSSIVAQSTGSPVIGARGHEGLSGEILVINPPTTIGGALGGAKVDLRDNSDWQDIDVDGIEDICVRVTVINLSNASVSGEVWVTVGDTGSYANMDSVQAHGGFHIFHGLFVLPGDTVTFTCNETLVLFDNLPKLVDAVKQGVFWVWGKGKQSSYHIKYKAIYLGIHVTGSL